MFFINNYRLINNFLLVFTLSCIVFSFSNKKATAQETRYVSDYLLINLKTAPKPPFSTVTRIETGDELTVLDEDNEYYRVRTSNNKVGWVAKRYTTSKTPKSLIIKELEEKITTLENSDKEGFATLSAENADLQNQLEKSQSEITELEDKLTTLKTLNESLRTIDPDKFEAMKKLVADMQEQTTQQQESIDILEDQNSRLQNRSKIYWFATGAFVLLLGIIIGSLPSKKQKKSLSF